MVLLWEYGDIILRMLDHSLCYQLLGIQLCWAEQAYLLSSLPAGSITPVQLAYEAGALLILSFSSDVTIVIRQSSSSTERVH